MMVVKGFQEIWRLKLPLLSHDIRNTRWICFEEFAASGQDTPTSVARYHCVTFWGWRECIRLCLSWGVLDSLSLSQFSKGFWGSVWETNVTYAHAPRAVPNITAREGERERERTGDIVLQFCKLELRSMWNWDASSVTCRFFIELWSGWMFSLMDIWKNLAAKITTFQPWEECCRIFLIFSCWRWMK